MTEETMAPTMRGYVRLITDHWALIAISSAYLIATSTVLLNEVTPIVDEWIYIQSATEFAETGRIQISIMSLAVALFESLYGALAVLVGGAVWETFALASSLLALAGGIAMYDLLFRASGSASLSGLMTGAYLFSPLIFALNTTFMTDGHAISLALMSAALFSRGVDEAGLRESAILGGSILAALAYLSRPAAVMVAFMAAGLLLARKRYREALLASALPALAVFVQLIYQFSEPTPTARSIVLDGLAPPSLISAERIALTIALQTGITLLPLLPIVFFALYRGVRRRSLALLGAAIVLALATSNLYPYGDWLNSTGLFPIDTATVGNRPEIASISHLKAILVFSLVSLCAAVALIAGNKRRLTLYAAEVGLWGFALTSIALSALSLTVTSGVLLDRYAMVVMPAALLSLVLRLPSISTIGLLASTIMLTGLASLSVVLTIDGYRTQNSLFALAERGIAVGIDIDELDGGAAWTGLHHGGRISAADINLPTGEAWWRRTFAPDLKPRFVVTINEVSGCPIDRLIVDPIIGREFQVYLVDQRTPCS